MLDMGFREDLEEILDATPAERRTLLFSATMPKPIVALAKRYQRDALRISTVGEERGHGDIAYQAMTVAPGDIEHAVVNLLRLHEAESALLFCATRDNVRRLHSSLTERGFNAVALSGEHSQSERNTGPAGASRRPRARTGRDRRRGARHRPAEPLPRRPCRAAARRRDPSAPLRPHRAGRQEGDRDPRRPLSAPQAGRVGASRALASRRNGSSRRRPRIFARSDRERLLAALLAPAEIEDEDRELALQAFSSTRVPRRSPPPWSASIARGCPRRRSWPTPARRRASRPEGPRPGFEDTIWFRMDIGRRHNADPRWILPLLCRRGHITKNEIGAIRIAAGETLFEVPRAAAGRFAAALKRTAGGDSDGEGGIRSRRCTASPATSARDNRRSGPSARSPQGETVPPGAEAGTLSASGPARSRGRAGRCAGACGVGDVGERIAVDRDQRGLAARPDRTGAASRQAVRVDRGGRERLARRQARPGPAGRARRAAPPRDVRAGRCRRGSARRRRESSDDERDASAHRARCFSARRSGGSLRQLDS